MMMYILGSRNEDAVISGIKYGRLKLERENVRAIPFVLKYRGKREKEKEEIKRKGKRGEEKER